MSPQPDVVFKSTTSHLVLFNFHPESDIQQLHDALTSHAPSRPRVVVLAGLQGSGRRYRLAAAVHRAEQGRIRLRSGTLDLDGFEPGAGSLDAYLTHQLSKIDAGRRARLSAAMDRLKLQAKLQPSMWGISLFSIALSADVPIKELAQLVGKTFDSRPGASRSARERFALVLKQLTESGRLCVHVPDAIALPEIVYTWLLDELASNLDMTLVVSTRSGETVECGDLPAFKMEVPLLSEESVRARLDERFSPNSFPPGLHRAAWSYSQGYPGRLAIKIVDLIETDAIAQDADGSWSLRQNAFEDRAFLDLFGIDEVERVRLAIAGLHAAVREPVRQFVQIAALCGDAIPVRPVALLCGVTLGDLDSFIDTLDERFDPPLFEDLGYSHPSFPRELVYRFANPVTGPALATRLTSVRRAELASALLANLQSTHPPDSRGRARLYLELAKHCSDDVSESYRHRLSWWITAEEAEEFALHIGARIDAGQLDSVQLLRQVRRHHRDDWPHHLCLALLLALDGNGAVRVPERELAELYALTGRVLFDLGRLNEAGGAAAMTLTLAAKGSSQRAEGLEIAGYLDRLQGRYQDSADRLAEARTILASLFGGAATIGLDVALAGLYRILRRYEESERLYVAVIATLERSNSAPHLLAITLDNLSVLYSNWHRRVDAERLCRRAIGIFERTVGTDHVDTAQAKANLAAHCKDTGRLHEAAELLMAALDTFERHVGPLAYQVGTTADNLGCVYEDMGRLQDALPMMRRALAILEGTLGRNAPDVATVLSNIAGVYEKLGDGGEATASLERALAIVARLPGRERDVLSYFARLRRLRNALGPLP